MAKTSARIAREIKTLGAMIRIYCRGRHGSTGELCSQCAELRAYAERRLGKCPFGAGKPTCANCPIHCYRVDMREQVREVMRYAGPRMIWRHPVLAALHLVDGRREAPPLPARRTGPRNNP
ncbi:MAG: nitrous oxide-stimulated promoter family protein [Syntrophaceae bacterium]|nr:nitrous oxide-stimulated promoter family protein [Syntrophaceae bacterium]